MCAILLVYAKILYRPFLNQYIKSMTTRPGLPYICSRRNAVWCPHAILWKDSALFAAFPTCPRDSPLSKGGMRETCLTRVERITTDVHAMWSPELFAAAYLPFPVLARRKASLIKTCRVVYSCTRDSVPRGSVRRNWKNVHSVRKFSWKRDTITIGS